MKRLFLTLTIALGLTLSSFANGEDVTPAAVESFKSSFKDASDVNWTSSENYFKANFTLNGQFISAYYDAQGKMLALTRNITSFQLPITLQANLKKNYDGYWISDLFEMANEEGTFYYITIENADTRLVLKSTSSSEWSKFQKQCKS